MPNLLILGAGQYGAVAKETAQAMDCFDRIDFLDDYSPLAIGKTAEAEQLRSRYDAAFVALGNSVLRKQWIERLERWGYALPVLQHPQATIMPSAQIGKGSIVEAQAVINSNAQVGIACLVCAGAVISHNAVVEDYCQIDCHATISACSHVPANSKIPCGEVFKD